MIENAVLQELDLTLYPSKLPCLALVAAVSLGGAGLGACHRSDPEGTDAGAIAPADLGAQPVAERLGEALATRDRIRRAAAVASLLDQLSPEQLDGVLEAYSAAFFHKGDLALVLLAEWWSRFAPLDAMDWMSENWITRDHPRIEAAILRGWARRAPLEVRDALSDRRNLAWRRIARQELIEALVMGWFDSGEPGLFEWIASLSYTEDRQTMLGTFARMRVLRDGPEATIRWAQELPEEPEDIKRWAMRSAVAAVMLIDPEFGARYAMDLAGAGEDGLKVVARVMNPWIAADPDAAMDWLRTTALPDDLREPAVGRAFGHWRSRAPAEADAWLFARPGEAWLDGARRRYASEMFRQVDVDWEQVMEEVLRITREPLRWSVAQRTAQRWLVDDAAAAEAWMARQSLPDGFLEEAHDIPPGVRRERTRLREKGHPPPF